MHFDVLIPNFESDWNYFEFLTPHKAIENALVGIFQLFGGVTRKWRKQMRLNYIFK